MDINNNTHTHITNTYRVIRTNLVCCQPPKRATWAKTALTQGRFFWLQRTLQPGVIHNILFSIDSGYFEGKYIHAVTATYYIVGCKKSSIQFFSQYLYGEKNGHARMDGMEAEMRGGVVVLFNTRLLLVPKQSPCSISEHAQHSQGCHPIHSTHPPSSVYSV